MCCLNAKSIRYIFTRIYVEIFFPLPTSMCVHEIHIYTHTHSFFFESPLLLLLLLLYLSSMVKSFHTKLKNTEDEREEIASHILKKKKKVINDIINNLPLNFVRIGCWTVGRKSNVRRSSGRKKSKKGHFWG